MYQILLIMAVLLSWMFYSNYRKRQKIRRELSDSLDDETIHVDGVRVSFEDLGEIAKGDPEEGVKYVKDTMFREDLMQFKGEFLIPGLPLNEERRLSIDDCFLYLQELFGKDLLLNKDVLTVHDAIFPVEINSTSEIVPLAHSVARIMDIDPKKLKIGFFQGSAPVDPASVDNTQENKSAAGLYYGKNENGIYEVNFADNIHQEPERLIATIAHEFAHIKLLGEERMDENAEELTDMVPLFYGFGLFNSNAVFKFSRTNENWSTNTLGYLSQVDWAYLFALYRYVRNEKDPEWFRHLNKTIAKDSDLAYDFILANPAKVLQSHM